jgi:hypothetical protein
MAGVLDDQEDEAYTLPSCLRRVKTVFASLSRDAERFGWLISGRKVSQ